MKFATSRDGIPLLVSRDLCRAQPVDDVASSLLSILRQWSALASLLESRYALLNEGAPEAAMDFDARSVTAPIVRPSQWIDGSAFENHGRLMEKAFGLPPADYRIHPMMYQGNADDFIGPCDDVIAPSESDALDFEGELGVILDHTPMGTTTADALRHVQLLVLINDVSLRAHAVREMKTGFGWIQAKPCTALSPVAITPDEIGSAWAHGRCALPLICERNGEWFGSPRGDEMSFGFDQLIAYAAYSRPLRAGTLIGSGTFSNKDRSAGSACITERRAIEMIEVGEPRTTFLQSGERVRLQMLDANQRSLFGAIDQCYRAANAMG